MPIKYSNCMKIVFALRALAAICLAIILLSWFSDINFGILTTISLLAIFPIFIASGWVKFIDIKSKNPPLANNFLNSNFLNKKLVALTILSGLVFGCCLGVVLYFFY